MNLLADDMTAIFNETGVAGNGTVFNYDWNMAWSLTTGLWCIGGMIGKGLTKKHWFDTSDLVSLFLFRKMNQESKLLGSCFESKHQETAFSSKLIRTKESRNSL